MQGATPKHLRDPSEKSPERLTLMAPDLVWADLARTNSLHVTNSKLSSLLPDRAFALRQQVILERCRELVPSGRPIGQRELDRLVLHHEWFRYHNLLTIVITRNCFISLGLLKLHRISLHPHARRV